MSIPSWARVGAKVQCIFAAHLRHDSSYDSKCQNVVAGEIYTIRAVKVIGGEAGVWLQEVRNPKGNPKLGLNGETGFHLIHFIPLVLDEGHLHQRASRKTEERV